MQRLYWACRRYDGFPGILPDEPGNNVTTSDILVGLALNGPDLNKLNFSGGLKSPKQRHSVSQLLFDEADPSPPGNQLPKPLPLPIPVETRVRSASRAASPSLSSALSLAGYLCLTKPRKIVPVHNVSRMPSTLEEKQGKHQLTHQAAAIPSTSTSTPTFAATVTTSATTGVSHPAVVSTTDSTDFSEPLALDTFCDLSSWTTPAPSGFDSDSRISHCLYAPDSFDLEDQQHVTDSGAPSQ